MADDGDGRNAGGTRGIVYLLLTDGGDREGGTAWRRGRSLLQEVDRKLAETPIRYRVRTWQAGMEPMHGPLHPAGTRSRGDFRRGTGRPDFGQLLTAMRIALDKDRRTIGVGTDIPATAIVLFAAGVPLADPDTIRAYDALVRETALVWVVPKGLLDLMSPVFMAGSARVVVDHPEAAEEVRGLLDGGCVADRERGVD